MKRRRPGIQTHYVDALGKRHDVEPARDASSAIAARRCAGGATRAATGAAGRAGSSGASSSDAVIVASRAEPVRRSRLEDGTALTVDGALPADLPAGYHRSSAATARTARLIVAPATCYLPESLRIWGWAIQLYAARSRRSWGIGDLADLRRLGRWAAACGCRDRAHQSARRAAADSCRSSRARTFPSSRRFRSPLYLRVEEVDGARDARDLPAIARRGTRAECAIGGSIATRCSGSRCGALERIWAAVSRTETAGARRLHRRTGRRPAEFATFCALAERFSRAGTAWPSELRHPSSPAVRAAARPRPMADRIRFHQWLQLQIDRQLARASRVGAGDAGSADRIRRRWRRRLGVPGRPRAGHQRRRAARRVQHARGQNWGLPPFVPGKLRAAGYEPFIETIRACVRHAGGLRIDHVMGLFRLFWIPDGMEPRATAPTSGATRATCWPSSRSRASAPGR